MLKEVGELRGLAQMLNFVILQGQQCNQVSENEIKNGGYRAKFGETGVLNDPYLISFPHKQWIG